MPTKLSDASSYATQCSNMQGRVDELVVKKKEKEKRKKLKL